MLELAQSRCLMCTFLLAAFLFLFGIKQHIVPTAISGAWNKISSTSHIASPIIFVGGLPRSGTTLMRVLLDVHPWIRCGPEGMVIKPILEIRHRTPSLHMNSSTQAGIPPDLLDWATAQYIRQIVEGMGPPARILCYKRPEVLLYMEYLARIFLDSQFVVMLRDGRAVAVSNERWGSHTLPYLYGTLHRWMKENLQIIGACQRVGPKRCIIIRYELLVLNPERELKALTEFLGIPWDPVMLHHETLVRKISSLNPHEPSTPQVIKKINMEALTRWMRRSDSVTKTFIDEAPKRCWLLKTLGFLDIGEPPDYSKLPRKIGNLSAFSPTNKNMLPTALKESPNF
ncbi:Protein-tyrosine sulfotransferase 2 [Clonorchis sinensis]|uniref:Protein-tyrosine sulfotransferase n=1 Tax=Clonorchis sinensis TaxID=79923 RepID=A0A8T1N299_CLOSI|nr:Protein-tyrosine sulfotransferase 2 [Clonorchis sinensis]